MNYDFQTLSVPKLCNSDELLLFSTFPPLITLINIPIFILNKSYYI